MKNIPTLRQLRSRYEQMFQTDETQQRRHLTWQQSLMWFCARPVSESCGRPCWLPVEKQLFRVNSASIPMSIVLPGRGQSVSAFTLMQQHMAPLTTSSSSRCVEHNQAEATLRALTSAMTAPVHNSQQSADDASTIPPWKRVRLQPPERPAPQMPGTTLPLPSDTDSEAKGTVGQTMRGWPPPPPPAIRVQNTGNTLNHEPRPSH